VKNRDAITPDFIGFICREIALTAAIYCSLIQAANRVKCSSDEQTTSVI